MTILQSLRSVSAYPIPSNTIISICEEEGINAQGSANAEVRSSAEYKRAKAQVYFWLAEAPAVTQGGISYSFGETERARLRTRGEELLGDVSNDSDGYGYIGSDL